MMRKGCGWAVALALVLLGPGGAAGEPRTLTLDEALDRAFRNRPLLEASEEAVKAARELVQVAQAGYYPVVRLEASYARSTGNYAPRPDLVTPDSRLGGNSNSSYNYFNFGLSLYQPIWDFGRTSGANDRARAAVETARTDVAVARSDLWFQVVLRYYGALAARELVRVAEAAREHARVLAEKAEAMYRSGVRNRVDVVQTQARLLSAENELLGAKVVLSGELAALVGAMGEHNAEDLSLVRPIEGEPTLPDVETAVARALAARPERARLEAQIREQETELKRIRGDYWPVLYATGSVSEAGSRLGEMAWNWQVGAGLSWSILNAVPTVHQARAAQAVLDGLRASLRDLDAQVRSDVEGALVRLRDTRARQPSLGAAVTVCEEGLVLAEQRYKAGEANHLEVLEAQRILAQAEAARVQGGLEADLARLALLRALGEVPQRLRTSTPAGEGRP